MLEHVEVAVESRTNRARSVGGRFCSIKRVGFPQEDVIVLFE